MTAFRFVTLTCDECGEIFDGGTDRTIPDARRNARQTGWQYDRQRGDTCPLHHGWTRTEYGYYRPIPDGGAQQ